MNIHRALIFLLCSLLSLNVAAGTWAGCASVDKALAKAHSSVAASHDHCDEMNDADSEAETYVANSHASHADCNSCKTHCSSASLLISIDAVVAFVYSK